MHKTPAGVSGPEVHQPDLDELKRNALSPEERLLKEIEELPDRVGAYLNLAAILTGLGAGVPGLVDYLFAIPPNSSAKVTGPLLLGV